MDGKSPHPFGDDRGKTSPGTLRAQAAFIERRILVDRIGYSAPYDIFFLQHRTGGRSQILLFDQIAVLNERAKFEIARSDQNFCCDRLGSGRAYFYPRGNELIQHKSRAGRNGQGKGENAD